MTEQDNSTPRPWLYQENADAYTHIIRGPSNYFITQLGQDSSGRTKADAQLIVSAVNSYDDLLRLLRWCVDTLRVRSPEALALHPEGSQAAALLAKLERANG
jgi:hypothetical protein